MPNLPLMTPGNVPVDAPQHRSETRLRRAALRRAAACAVVALGMTVSSGCQCLCCGTNAYSCLIDCIADHPPCVECLYCAKLDLTRINRPGGCQCCRCCCKPQQCCAGGVYAHRWNSPPAQSMSSTAGLRDAAVLPDNVAGPYFPPAEAARPDVAPPADDGSPVPLFEQPQNPMSPEPLPMEAPPAAPPTDSGVVRMNYLAPAESPPVWQVPVNVLFGQ